MIRLHSGGYVNTDQLKLMIRTIQDVMWDFIFQGLVASYCNGFAQSIAKQWFDKHSATE
jgi:hypothetical protein